MFVVLAGLESRDTSRRESSLSPAHSELDMLSLSPAKIGPWSGERDGLRRRRWRDGQAARAR